MYICYNKKEYIENTKNPFYCIVGISKFIINILCKSTIAIGVGQ